MTAPAARVQDGPGPRETRPLAPRTELRALLSKPGSRTILLDGSRDPNSGVTMLVTPPGADGPHAPATPDQQQGGFPLSGWG